jgi:two-component system chemotaxis response regulator CheY
MSARILIAEDDPFSLSLLKLILESAGGFEITSATDGTEAWALLEAGPAFDLCIFDIMMPGIDGLQLTSRMRSDQRFKHQRVMLCTALNDRSRVDQAAALAISHYIVKPYSRDHVVKQVRKICASTTASVRLEPLADVASRLGIESTQVMSFLADLNQAAGKLIAELRAKSGKVLDPNFVLRVNSLKGAAMNLGAKSLAEQLTALEALLSESKNPSLDSALSGLEAEHTGLNSSLQELSSVPPAKAESSG